MAQPKPKYSNPVLERTVTLNSEYTQRTFHRGFKRTARALYAIDVILRIIGNDEETDEVEDAIDKMISDWVKAITDERGRLQELRKANGIDADPVYTAPKEIKIRIASPQAGRYMEMLRLYDSLVKDIDALWMHQILTNKQRRQLIHDWQRRTLRLGNKIVDIERRAHKAAKSKGKEDEVRESIGEESADEEAGENEESEAATNKDEPIAVNA